MSVIMKNRILLGTTIIILIFIVLGGYLFYRSPVSPVEEPEEGNPVEEPEEDDPKEEPEEDSFVPDITHTGDLVVSGNETRVIENTRYFQQGNVYVNDEAKLIIRDSQFMLGRGDVHTIHVYITVDSKAKLEIENSTIFQNIFPEAIGHPTHIVVRTGGGVSIIDSPTAIHLLEISGGAHVKIVNSQLVNKNPPGGLVQVASDTDTEIINSTIGAIGLNVPRGSHLSVSGLRSGVNLESWNVSDVISDADYRLVLKRTRILKDEANPGPYERGWIFFADPQANVNISNSELRKVFIDVQGGEARFENLRIGSPSSLRLGNIELSNVTMRGQWSFTLKDANLTITGSEYLFLQPTGTSNLCLVNSHMVEFIPRDFFGTIDFTNCTWTVAGEIIGGLPYHSMENNFTIRGSLKLASELRDNLQWKDAQVVREYDVITIDENGDPIKGALVSIEGEEFMSDDDGKSRFSLVLNGSSYDRLRRLEVFKGGILIAQKDIDFFTETPILIIGDEPS